MHSQAELCNGDPKHQTQNTKHEIPNMPNSHGDVKGDETLDDLLCGDLRVIQKKNGYRFSIDAVLLTNFIGGVPKGESIIDLGTGCGVIPILLAHKTGIKRIVGVEIQGDLADMAGRSIELNDLSQRIAIIHEDLNNLMGLFKAETFDMVVSNPPYQRVDSGRINPDPQKAIARHEIRCSLEDVLAVAEYLVRPKGRVYLTFPAARLADLMSGLNGSGLEAKRLQVVYSGRDPEGKLILLEASKGGGKGLKILKPLFTNDLNGKLLNPNH